LVCSPQMFRALPSAACMIWVVQDSVSSSWVRNHLYRTDAYLVSILLFRRWWLGMVYPRKFSFLSRTYSWSHASHLGSHSLDWTSSSLEAMMLSAIKFWQMSISE
jgi:hypothetical protein